MASWQYRAMQAHMQFANVGSIRDNDRGGVQVHHTTDTTTANVAASTGLRGQIAERAALPPTERVLCASTKSLPPNEALLHDDAVLDREVERLTDPQWLRRELSLSGFSQPLVEDPGMVHLRVQELISILERSRQSEAYLVAVRQRPAFIFNNAFLIMFLRAEKYNPQRAAKRIFLHFELKREFFGDHLLTTRIRWDHLDPMEQHVLRTNATIQLLPRRDQAGRAVFFSFERGHRDNFPPLNSRYDPRIFNCRLIWFLMMSVIENDPETQLRGIVYIGWGLGYVPVGDRVERSVWWGGCKVANAIPVRLESFHYLYDDVRVRPVLNLLTFGLNFLSRCRFEKLFVGPQRDDLANDEETTRRSRMATALHRLEMSGIPTGGVLPLTENGELRTRHSKRLCVIWRRTEHLDFTILPSNEDVICATGQGFQNRPANIRFRELVQEHRDESRRLTGRTRSTADEVVSSWIALMQMSSLRFIEPRGKAKEFFGLWVPATPERIAEKISNLLSRRADSMRATEEED